MPIKSQQVGKQYEKYVDIAGVQYKLDGRAFPQVNYPEIIITKFPQATIVGPAAADRTYTLTPDGRACHLEIKTWKAKDNYKYSFEYSENNRRRRRQYEWLIEAHRFGALCYYLVCWRWLCWHWQDMEEWRLYPVEMIDLLSDGLQFQRHAGLFVPSDEGWPDWLSVIER